MKTMIKKKHVMLALEADLVEFLSLYALTHSTTKTRLLANTATTAIKRMRTNHCEAEMLQARAESMKCHWLADKQRGISKLEFISHSIRYLKNKGLNSIQISTIIDKFNAKEKDNGTD